MPGSGLARASADRGASASNPLRSCQYHDQTCWYPARLAGFGAHFLAKPEAQIASRSTGDLPARDYRAREGQRALAPAALLLAEGSPPPQTGREAQSGAQFFTAPASCLLLLLPLRQMLIPVAVAAQPSCVVLPPIPPGLEPCMLWAEIPNGLDH